VVELSQVEQPGGGTVFPGIFMGLLDQLSPICYLLFGIRFPRVGMRHNGAQRYTAASCCTVYSEQVPALLTGSALLHRCITIYTSRAFASDCYSNTAGFCPNGHHQVYKLWRKLLSLSHASTLRNSNV
jgi:hypothetical protein